jgi:hypothetical protein
MAGLASPVLVSIVIVGGYFLTINTDSMFVDAIISALPVLLLAGMWVLYSKEVTLPEKASQLFLPLVATFSYYMCMWIIAFSIKDYSVAFYRLGPDGSRESLFFIFTVPYFVINLVLFEKVNLIFFPVAYAAVTVIIALSIIITCKICKKKINFDKRTIIYASMVLLLSGFSVFQFNDRESKILSYDNQVERILEEIGSYYYYVPFS